MTKTYLVVIIAALAAVPMVAAHEPKGTYKNYCEDSSEWLVHEYGAPASGFLLQGYEDGNLQDCDGSGLTIPDIGAEPCPEWLPIVIPPVHVCLDYVLADFDGHAEFAFGGAYLLVTSGAGVPSDDPNVGAGTLYCFGAEGHHANFVSLTVDDLVFGAGVEVAVGTDTVDLLGVGEGCGDFETDVFSAGVGTVTATFPAGLDGAYDVYVCGSQGHIVSN